MEYYEWIEKFSLQDPDYVVDVLGITTEELLEAFPWKVKEHYEEEWG